MDRELALSAFKEASDLYRSFARWLAWCDGLKAAKAAAGLFELETYDKNLGAAVEQVYIIVNKQPKLPSKERKHQMYYATYRAASAAGVDAPTGSLRDMEGIAQALAKIAAALAV